MKNTIFRLLIVIGVISSSFIIAREFRTPLSLYRGYNHYPVPPLDDNCLNFSIWGAGLHRDTNGTFVDKNSLKTENLAGIFFNAENFLFINTLVPGSFDPLNPLLSVLELFPRFDYSENVAFFGFDLYKSFGCCDDWHIGVRGNLPIRAVDMELNSCCDLAETIEDVRVARQKELVPDENGVLRVVQDAFAYRLDFLASLPLEINNPTDKLVKFSDPTAAGHITMAGQDVTDAPPATINKNPVHVIGRPDGTVPPAPFSAVFDPTVMNAPCLPNDGSGVGTNVREKFCAANNYTALGNSIANQRALWVVPTDQTQPPIPGGTFGLVPVARDIQTATEAIISGLSQSVLDFLAANGINFNSQRNFGLGDLYTEFYLNRWWCNGYGEAFFGIVFPTGKRVKDPKQLLLVPTGNNGHVELRVGGAFGWNPCEWFALKVDALYSFVMRRSEKVAASFAGATIKNIGPTVDADVSWGYFVGDVDATFLVPCTDIGFDLGYQVYVKRRDHVRFNQQAAIDFLGNTQRLDPFAIEQRTDQIAHRVKTEMFYHDCNWETFAGWTTVFAGKNAPRDTDWYIGFAIYF